MWAALAVVTLAAFAAEPKPALRLESLTGTVQWTTPDGFVAVARGVALPLTIAPGARVDVLRGEACFASGRVAVRARAGDGFRFLAVTGAPGEAAFELAAVGPRTTLLVEAGESSWVVYEGDKVAVAERPDGGLELQARSGTLSVLGPRGATILSPGQFARLERAVSPGEPPPSIVEPGEELRSAVGPKPAGPCGKP